MLFRCFFCKKKIVFLLYLISCCCCYKITRQQNHNHTTVKTMTLNDECETLLMMMMTKTPTCLTVRACLRFVGSLVLRVFVGWSSSLIRAALLWCCAWQKVLLRTNFLVDVPLFWRFDVSPR